MAYLAIRAIDKMVQSPDFDRKMLLLATQLAHENGMRALLMAILENLLSTLEGSSERESEVEAVTLIRCVLEDICSGH